MTQFPKPKAWRNKKYLNFIRKQPVLIGGQGDTVAHHVRINGNAGIGMKPSDFYAVPSPDSIHKAFHAGQESDKGFLRGTMLISIEYSLNCM